MSIWVIVIAAVIVGLFAPLLWQDIPMDEGEGIKWD